MSLVSNSFGRPPRPTKKIMSHALTIEYGTTATPGQHRGPQPHDFPDQRHAEVLSSVWDLLWEDHVHPSSMPIAAQHPAYVIPTAAYPRMSLANQESWGLVRAQDLQDLSNRNGDVEGASSPSSGEVGTDVEWRSFGSQPRPCFDGPQHQFQQEKEEEMEKQEDEEKEQPRGSQQFDNQEDMVPDTMNAVTGINPLPAALNGVPVTTLALRNLPPGLKVKQLLQSLPHPDEANYNLLYVPVKAAHKNVSGYAFINFDTHEDAAAFYHQWQGRYVKFPSSTTSGDSRVIKIVAADRQGFATSVLKWAKSMRGVHNSTLLPMIYLNGQRQDFWQVANGLTSLRTQTDGSAFLI